MPLNPYFHTGSKSEQRLVDQLWIEAIRQYGFETKYLPRTIVARDAILNEAILSSFNNLFDIEMYIENVDGFGGDGTLFTKFGLEIRQQATFVVSRNQWLKLVGQNDVGVLSNRPAEGDLIYFPLGKMLFEIKYVDNQSPFFQLSNVPVWTMTCELFEYSNDQIQTGDSNVDSFQQNDATEYYFGLANGNGILPQVGEIVTQIVAPATNTTAASIISGTVLKIANAVSGVPIVALGLLSTNTGAYGMFDTTVNVGTNLIGSTSGASWSISRVYDIADTDVQLTFVTNNQQAQNAAFETAAKNIIDFSETDPFGEIATIG
jgi:hypothetical protein